MFLLKTPGCSTSKHPGVFVADIGLYAVYNNDIQYSK